MSNFQLGLVIAGALILIVVVAHNAWTSRRNTPKRPSPPPHGSSGSPGGDGSPSTVAMDAGQPLGEPGQRHEPALDGSPWPESGDAVPQLQVDGAAALDGASAAAASARASAPRRGGSLDALIDAIVPMAVEASISGDAALAAMPGSRRVGSKTFAIEGLNEATGQWQPPQSGQRYQQLQAGVQLANRTGALNEIEFSEFVMKVQGFADAINAAPDFPDMLHEVARARELDQFAGEHDAQLTFSLRARQTAWSPGYVQQCATQQGFVLGPLPGRLVLPASVAGAAPLLTLAYDPQTAMAEEPEQTAIYELTLSLDVPQVARTEQPFARLRSVADALTTTMDGVLCDQNGTALPSMAMDPIATDLEQLYDQLDQRELSAGSVLARRLFS